MREGQTLMSSRAHVALTRSLRRSPGPKVHRTFGNLPAHPNAALVAFALAITAKDGLWALLAFAFTGATGYWLIGLL